MTAVHLLTEPEARAVCVILAAVEHIPVTAQLDKAKTVHITPVRELTVLEEVTALRAFAAVTDGRLAWHKAAAIQSTTQPEPLR